MKKRISYRVIAVLIVFMLAIGSMSGMAYAEETQLVSAASKTALQFRDLTAEQITAEMGPGWTLGNTMDGHTGMYPGETLLQNVKTTKELIVAVHGLGFNTVRIPVTWGKKINDDYSIDEKWINRVQEIVDYCVSLDMYAIINIQHDDDEESGWLRIDAEGEQLEAVKEKFAGVWNSIATNFRDYDEHLLFESMNELSGADDSNDGIVRDFGVIEELNQIFVDTVRSTGSNNACRWLVVPGRNADINDVTNADYGFELPVDSVNAENRLMVSVHYDAFDITETQDVVSYYNDSALELADSFSKLADTFTSKGVPVLLGEYGVVSKNNVEAAAGYYEVVARLSRVSGIIPCALDQGLNVREEDPDYSYTFIDRKTCETMYKEVTDAIMRGYYVLSEDDSAADLSAIVSGREIGTAVEVNPITYLAFESETLTIEAGSCYRINPVVEPADTNDVILYRSSDESVVTVYNGYVRARGIGQALIAVYSQSGSVIDIIGVVVVPNTSLNSPINTFRTKESSYRLAIGGSETIVVATSPMTTDDQITFRSSDESIVTVDQVGKMTAISEGRAIVTMTTQTGVTNYVNVVVSKTTAKLEATLALYTYYNDSENSYFGNDKGESITVTGNGTYTLKFDCAAHLSTEARSAGVNSLTNVGAIYIKDITDSSSTFTSANIFYEEIIVDGVALTINQTEPKSAIKSTGVFDTNDPINAWDGSVVEEVSVEEFVLNFTTLTDPTTVSVKFTLSDVAFEGGEAASNEDEIRTETLTTGTLEGNILTVNAVPFDTTECVTFIPGDSSVLWVDSVRTAVDPATGMAAVRVVSVGPGTTSITACTDLGVMCTITISNETEAEEAVGEHIETVDLSGYMVPVVKVEEPEELPVEVETEPDDTDSDEDKGENSVKLDNTSVAAIAVTAVVVLAAAICSVILIGKIRKAKSAASSEKKEEEAAPSEPAEDAAEK